MSKLSAWFARFICLGIVVGGFPFFMWLVACNNTPLNPDDNCRDAVLNFCGFFNSEKNMTCPHPKQIALQTDVDCRFVCKCPGSRR